MPPARHLAAISRGEFTELAAQTLCRLAPADMAGADRLAGGKPPVEPDFEVGPLLERCVACSLPRPAQGSADSQVSSKARSSP